MRQPLVARARHRIAQEGRQLAVGQGPRPRLLLAAGAIQELYGGRLDDAALADEYRQCAMFVLPARRTAEGDLEGYGLVYFEAAAWGRPVVAGRSGGEIDAVEDGRTGVLVDGTDVNAVAGAIRTLLGDPQKLEALGAAGRKRVETTYNWTSASSAAMSLSRDSRPRSP